MAAESTVELLAVRVAQQVVVLSGLEPLVRADVPDAVHRMRVAARRLRSALREYGGPGHGLAAELRWLGGALGGARDTEVLGAALAEEARALPAELAPEEIAAELAAWTRHRSELGRAAALAALDSPRYRALLGDLGDLTVRPLDGDGLPEPAELVAAARRRVRRRLKRARKAAAGPERDRALHEARKAAKRARYLGETLAVPKLAGRMKALQDVLGLHQDSVVARAALRELAAQGHAFEYGVLYAGQAAVARAVERQFC
ncbi:CHAD domain-containing protein [Kitasatospora sp. NPDC051853]|uniref:CHAD domain-containing protein n=1 Tax=Kitasatospora sp. NPDC051853 TaxID=3364058 RepID=UPI003796C3C8